MKKLLLLLMLLLWPAWASAQIVTPGGGGSVANGTVTGGTCPANQFVNAIGNPTGVPTCAVPPSGTGYPAGTTPQMTGYASANNSEAETLGGDATLARPSAGNYTITVTKTSGVAFTGLATASIPLVVVNGGTGTASPPTTGQMLIANSGTSYAPVTMSGDCSVTSAGAITCTKTTGVAFTALATAPVPLSVANGGHGSGTAPTSAQIPIAQSATAYTPQTISGDATITNAGVITVTKTSGVAFTALATATVPLSIANGGRGSSTAPTAGQIDVAQSATAFGPVTMSGDGTLSAAGAFTLTKTTFASPTLTGTTNVSNLTMSGASTLTFPDTSTWTSTGPNVVAASTVTLNNTASTAIKLPSGSLNAAGGNVQLAAGAHNTATGWMADSTGAAIVSPNTAANAGVSIYVNAGLVSGSTYTPTQTATFINTGLTMPATEGIGVGFTPTAAGQALTAVVPSGTSTYTNVSIQNKTTTGSSTYYLNDDQATAKYAAFTMYNSAFVPDIPEDQPDSVRILTNATNGLNIDVNPAAPIGIYTGGNHIFDFNPGNSGGNSFMKTGLVTPNPYTTQVQMPLVSTCHQIFGLAAGTGAVILQTPAGYWNVTSSGLMTIEVWDDTNANSYAKKVCTYAVDFDAGGNEWIGQTTLTQLHCGMFSPQPAYTVTVDGGAGSPQLAIHVNNTASYHEIVYVDYLQIHGAQAYCAQTIWYP